MSESSTAAVPSRDRTIVLLALAAVVVISWVYIVNLAGSMKAMPESDVMAIKAWTANDFLLMFLMWSVMMVGMMVPSATPAILKFAQLSREHRQHGQPYVPTAVFVLGYVTTWVVYSLGATLLQWALNALALLSPAMVLTSPIVGGVILLAAGIYQWTPIHKNFLAGCRNFFQILRQRFGEGASAYFMGMENGANCVGCCLVMMLLLFVGGIMNLLWVALIAVFVLIEKVIPYGEICGRVTGVLLVLGGLGIIGYHLAFQVT